MGRRGGGIFEYVPTGDEFFQLLTTYRTLWLAGRPGGGKTSLAVHFALRLVNDGYVARIGSNIPLTIVGYKCTEYDRSDPLTEASDIATIVDEAWAEVSQGNDKAVRHWLAYPRKRNQYLLFPSVLPVHRQVSVFRCERLLNGYMLGFPLWIYRYELAVALGDSVRGAWWWTNPAKVFTSYDHLYTLGAKYYVYEKFDTRDQA